ncbi:8-oxo-dGTP diphosphatase [Spirochaeta africana]|uniref:Oxidized purine nucleoside triphosphate hydrolase n=1 Tax=Spirochaeta africana (strain ATCC 700263 / DSM 8902 / Z-7692) TaxID=889378 RepID=H9UJ35_SPIAZ|nr:8-oxo-dGTP diphosphatase [Spirochaeta africana]AFG37528.1 ADP-ribose pyrophosphatase [Spirochaeta africana DSM 8902]
MIQFDTTTWNPHDLAVLCFIRSDEQLLLIRKKRGLGAGKINAPGGKCEPGELPIQTAIRETEEEVCVTPHQLEEYGTLRFIFADGYQLEGRIFIASAFSGDPAATDEADPFWCPVDRIPYDQMWEDDILWLPHVLAGNYIESGFVFDGDQMVMQSVHVCGSPAAHRLETAAASSPPGYTRAAAAILQDLRGCYAALQRAADQQPYLQLLSDIARQAGLTEFRAAVTSHAPGDSLYPTLQVPYLRAVSLLKEQIYLELVL